MLADAGRGNSVRAVRADTCCGRVDEAIDPPVPDVAYFGVSDDRIEHRGGQVRAIAPGSGGCLEAHLEPLGRRSVATSEPGCAGLFHLDVEIRHARRYGVRFAREVE